MAHDRAIGSILGDLGDQIGHLFRTELHLAEAEAEEKVKRVTMSLVPMLAGVVIVLAALIILLHAAAVFLIEQGLAASLSYLLVGAVAALVAYFLVQSGMKKLSTTKLMPERTIRQVRDDVSLAKENVP